MPDIRPDLSPQDQFALNLYSAARGFKFAAQILPLSPEFAPRADTMVLPTMALQAFSIELFLKSFLAKQGFRKGTERSRPPSRLMRAPRPRYCWWPNPQPRFRPFDWNPSGAAQEARLSLYEGGYDLRHGQLPERSPCARYTGWDSCYVC